MVTPPIRPGVRFAAGAISGVLFALSSTISAQPAPEALPKPGGVEPSQPPAPATNVPTDTMSRTEATAEATAEAEAPTEAPSPRLHHAPVSTARAHEAIEIPAQIDQPHRVARAVVVYRTAKSPRLRTRPFQRAPGGPWIAVIPSQDVQHPWVEYAIEIHTTDRRRLPVFASRKHMFRVTVPESLSDLRERAYLERLGGRRSKVFASGEYVLFGETDAVVRNPDTGILTPKGIKDQYYRLEAGYTYRPLGIVAEFSIRTGIVRGRSVVPNELNEDKFDVGLNYGSPMVRFRLADVFHLEASFLTSVTEVGFSTGAGGAMLIGDPYGSKLTVGFETVQTFGTRFYSRVDLAATERFHVAPIIEVTDMPHADRFGVRLLAEGMARLGSGFSLAARGGYQARTFTSGGPSGGGTLSYEF